jgi:hypothetical protein
MARWQAMAGDQRRLALVGAAALGLIAVIALAVLVTGGGGGDVAATAADGTSRATTATTAATTTVPPTTAAPTSAAAPPATAPAPATSPPTAPPTTAPPPPPPPPAPAAPAGGALCIGDSVMLGAGPQYGNTLSMCGRVDAVESRQASSGPDTLAADQPYPATVVIHLGTNGTVDGADLDAMLGALQGGEQVVLVTVQLNGTRSWEAQANGEITAAAGRWPNVRLADWKAASDGHPEWFAGDGIHLAGGGAQAYADVIAGAL